MTEITIPLDAGSVARLQELARQRGESVEQTAQALLLSTLPAMAPSGLPVDDPDGSGLILGLAGALTWPDAAGIVNTTNDQIDRLLAAEAMNPHDDQ